jgi:RNA polymerase sigma-70 factor (ECF subfamily)
MTTFAPTLFAPKHAPVDDGAARLASPPSDTRELVARAIARDRRAIDALVAMLAPVVHVRVARTLERSARCGRRDVRQDVEDLVQEVFSALFANGGRVLQAWDPERGASLINFVGLVAEHHVASILRSSRRQPWGREIASSDTLEIASPVSPEGPVASRQLFARVLDRLRGEVSPRGLELFYALVVHEEPLDAVCARFAMSADSVYAWRSRLLKRARAILVELNEPPSSRRAREISSRAARPGSEADTDGHQEPSR